MACNRMMRAPIVGRLTLGISGHLFLPICPGGKYPCYGDRVVSGLCVFYKVSIFWPCQWSVSNLLINHKQQGRLSDKKEKKLNILLQVYSVVVCMLFVVITEYTDNSINFFSSSSYHPHNHQYYPSFSFFLFSWICTYIEHHSFSKEKKESCGGCIHVYSAKDRGKKSDSSLIIQWLNEGQLVERLVDKLSPDADPEDHASADNLLCEISTSCRDTSTDGHQQTNPLLATLERWGRFHFRFSVFFFFFLSGRFYLFTG